MHTNSLERIVPDDIHETGSTGQQALALHLDRYRFAATQLLPGRVLDIACGVGYGTDLLFQTAVGCQYALGVDADHEAIAYAKTRYLKEGMTFQVGDAMTFSAPELFDSIVTLETIEHLPHPQDFITHLTSLLRPGGKLIASVPTTPTVDANPYHLHDFTEHSFRKMVNHLSLRECASYRQEQTFNPVTVLTRSEARLADLRPNLLSYYAHHPSALLQRMWSTLRHGFSIHYLTLVFQYEK